MAHEEVKAILQAIEQIACETIESLRQAAANFADVKEKATAALRLEMPQAVREIICAIKATACETYSSIMIANGAMQSVKFSAATAISILEME